ncbi:ribulose-phosphate 3-epimerase [Planctomicrobium sp. SH661]|uniref:ribulose-phosphate 3-epimerase n=1 Tax=Planctomicrobium sp. SH661 TaxID=3448124 RepID=UPI003F5B8BE8
MSNLRPSTPLVAPSMLKCDFGNLEREITRLQEAGARSLHLDVMDGHFVPNLTYGAVVIERIREKTSLPLDAHLMIDDPMRWVDDYIKAGCDWITVHIEALSDPVPVLRKIRDAGRLAGIALNPETPVSALNQCRGECDVVLVMSVHPGFGGQKFIPSSPDKIKEVRELFGTGTLISVDGGIGPQTISLVAAAGAEVYVAGSSIFDQSCYRTAIEEMESLAAAARTNPAE